MRLERERFGRKHSHALLLGEFFRRIYPAGKSTGTMTAYNQMGWLCDEPRVPRQIPDQARIEVLETPEHCVSTVIIRGLYPEVRRSSSSAIFCITL